jgi:hypothetical protein
LNTADTIHAILKSQGNETHPNAGIGCKIQDSAFSRAALNHGVIAAVLFQMPWGTTKSK